MEQVVNDFGDLQRAIESFEWAVHKRRARVEGGPPHRFDDLQRAIESFERAVHKRRAPVEEEPPHCPERSDWRLRLQGIRRYLQHDVSRSWRRAYVFEALAAVASAVYLIWANRSIKPVTQLGLLLLGGAVLWRRARKPPESAVTDRPSLVDVSGVKYRRSAWPIGVLFILALFGFGWVITNVLPTGSTIGEFADLSETRSGGWLSRQVTANQTFPHWERANALLDDGRLEEGEAELETVLDIDPDHLQARMTRARVLYQLDEHERVVADTTAVLERAPGFVPALLHRGMSAQALGDHTRAMADYRTIVEVADPASDARRFAAEAWADVALEDGDLAGVLEARAAVPEDSQDLRHFNQLGNALTVLGRVEQGLAAYENARALASSTADRFAVETAVAEAARADGNVQLARDSYVAALELRPQEPSTLRALSSLEYNEGNIEAADRWISQLAESDQTSADREFLANLRFERQRYRQAAGEFARALDIAESDDDRYRLFMAAGTAHTRAGRHADAARAFQQAAQIRGDEPTISALAQALESQGELAESIQSFERLDAIRPLAETRHRIGELRFRTQDPGRAIEDLDLAIARGLPPAARGQALRLRGFAFSQLGDYQQARASLEAALEFLTPDAAAYTQLTELAVEAEADRDVIRYLSRLAELEPTEATFRRLTAVHLKLGEVDAALSVLDQLSSLTGNPAAAETLVEIANLEFERGNHAAAGELYAEAFERRPLLDAASGARAAEAFALSSASESGWQRAVDINVRLLEVDGLPPAERARAFERLGHLQARLGRYADAAASFENAIAAGPDGWELRRNAGFMWSNLGRWDNALPHFQASLEQQRTPETLREAGLAYQQTGKPGLAIHYLQAALDLDEDTGGTSVPLKPLLDQLGYEYAKTDQPTRAAEVWQRSLNISEDPAIRVRLGRMHRLDQRLDLASATLADVTPELLPPDLQIELLQEQAAIHRAHGEYERAIGLLQEAAARRSEADLEYQLGENYRSLGAWDDAIRHFDRAHEMDGTNNLYAIDLGYAYAQTADYDRAAALFEEVLTRQPDYLRVYGDLGFLQLRLNDNAAAVDRFKQAIDNQRLQMFRAETEQVRSTDQQQLLRGTVTEVSRSLQGVVYLAPRSDSLAEVRTPGGVVGGVVPSHGGVELGYRPPNIGYRDGRILQLFGRTLWSFEPRSLRVASDSVQAGLGIRYKPLKTQSLFLSAERLIKIGDLAENNWLFRGLYSWEAGATRPRLGAALRDYTFVYADLGYFAPRSDRVVGYVEGRQGISFGVRDNLFVTPHFVVDGRFQGPNTVASSYIEGGVGVSLKYLFNSGAYDLHRSGLELFVHYKWGSFIESDAFSVTEGFQGLVITPVFSF